MCIIPEHVVQHKYGPATMGFTTPLASHLSRFCRWAIPSLL